MTTFEAIFIGATLGYVLRPLADVLTEAASQVLSAAFRHTRSS